MSSLSHSSDHMTGRPTDRASAVSSNVISLANFRDRRADRNNGAPRSLDASIGRRHSIDCGFRCTCSGERSRGGIKNAVEFVMPTAKDSRAECIELGATTESLASVAARAAEFSAWRLGSFTGRDDGVWAASEWSMWQRDRLMRGMSGRRDCEAVTLGAQRPASTTVRWALARFAFLLRTGVPLDVAAGESVTIPLEASTARPVTWEEHRARRERGQRFSRDNVVPGTVPVWTFDAAQFRAQRIFARRLLNIDAGGSVHDGWLTVSTKVADRFGWEAVDPASV